MNHVVVPSRLRTPPQLLIGYSICGMDEKGDVAEKAARSGLTYI